MELDAIMDYNQKGSKIYEKANKEKEDHEHRANQAYNAMKEAKDETKWDPKQWVCITMDLQQTQGVPKLSNGKAYYKRKLNLQNFCVYDLQQDQAYMYTWEENTAKRGSVEIYIQLS